MKHSSRGCSSKNSVLTQTALLLQDGLEFHELPMVIRRMTAAEFPFSSMAYTGMEVHKATDQDEAFRLQLRDCIHAQQVFHLLEVPGEKVTQYSAVFALQRMAQLQEHSATDIESFLQKAILRELWETGTSDIHGLTSEVLISLVRCYLNLSSYDQKYVNCINEEVERRIGDTMFAVPELCALVELLSISPQGSQDLIDNLWVHLGSRYKEIDHETVPEVYRVLEFVTPQHKYLLRVLDHQLRDCWWKLQSADVATVMKTMVLINRHSISTLTSFGKWLFMNIHDVNDSELKSILAAYTHFHYSDPNITKALERYVKAKVAHMDKTLVAMVMDHCASRRYLSPIIFNAVARDFQNNGHKYEPHEILYVLRPYGQLNYLPPNATGLFLKVEDVLRQKFSQLNPAAIVELLASFVYIERFPINFVSKVFTPHFLARITAISDKALKQKAGRHLLELQAGVILEFPKQSIQYVDRNSLGPISLIWLEGRRFKFHQEVGHILVDLLGPEYVNDIVLPKNTPHLIDYEINVDRDRCAIPTKMTEEITLRHKLALVSVMPEHYCFNMRHLLGQFAMKKRHLTKKGYTVIEMQYEDFVWKNKGRDGRMQYIRQLLEPYMQLPSSTEV